MISRIKEYEKYSYENWICIGNGMSEGLTLIFDIPFTELFVWDANPDWIKYSNGYRGGMENTLYMVSRTYAKSREWID